MASNQYVNKVELSDGTTLIDLTADTVVAEYLLEGYTAHDASGAPITGTFVSEEPVALSDAEIHAITGIVGYPDGDVVTY